MKTNALLLSLIALLLLPATARSEVLFNSTPTPGGTHPIVQDFETAQNAFDTEAADDFTVPAGQTWAPQRAFVDGVKIGGSGPGTTNIVNVAIYNSAGTLPAAGPPLYSAQVTSDPGTAYPDFDVPLPAAPVLGPGTYWFSAQARMDAGPMGTDVWSWGETPFQLGSGAVYRNPGDGYGTGCTTFTPLITCSNAASGPDLAFRLDGTRTVSPVQVATPPPSTPPSTPSSTPPVKCKKGQQLKGGKCVKKKKKKKK
jgi:hypothetical protein